MLLIRAGASPLLRTSMTRVIFVNQLSGIEEMQGLIDRVIMVTVRDITGCGCGSVGCPPASLLLGVSGPCAAWCL
jgi:hypothetical protein